MGWLEELWQKWLKEGVSCPGQEVCYHIFCALEVKLKLSCNFSPFNFNEFSNVKYFDKPTATGVSPN